MQTKHDLTAERSMSKAKARKQEQKARTIKDKQAKVVVDSLKQATDLLDQFPSFGTFKKNGCDFAIKFQHAPQVSSSTLTWAYELCEQNMRSMYEEVWGWKPSEKQKELKHTDARYLIAYSADGIPVAYLHFRFEVEDATPLLYVYEVQLVSSVQRKGLGAFLMTLLKLIAKKHQLDAIMLTVMNANTSAMKMYTKLGYKPDPTSPSQADPIGHLEEPTGYEILSLWLANK